AKLGVQFIGGCCGTTPAHIQNVVNCCRDIPFTPVEKKNLCVCSSYSHVLNIGERPIIIGERINPTGKKKFREALKNKDFEYILGEASAQTSAGADALDVNVGSPDIDEAEMMRELVPKIQAISDLPLQVDSSSPAALEAAMRVYNGKPLVNSVNGKNEVMEAVFPLVKKYGGVVVGLTLDEGGIPDSPEGRFEIAERIVNKAAEYGIERKDIMIDALTMTVATDDFAAKKTAEALYMIKTRLGVATVLGVSNVSFGLPDRPTVNAAFLDMAVRAGLDCAIYNPMAPKSGYGPEAEAVLNGLDHGCAAYIESRSNAETVTAKAAELTLEQLITTGQKERSYETAKEMLKTMPALELINGHIIPALNIVGDGFEKGKLFLPQLMSGADSAKRAFDAVREAAAGGGENYGTIVIATVKGDIHDIGKNIVKLLLQNYGYNVIDLGRDVDIDVIVNTMKETGAPLLGLSALMTTTVVNMEKTIKAVRANNIDCKIVVGGAVLTESYAAEIGADFYAKDALVTVGIANKIFGRE
ncbi:MAG: dihydropteroate synthase, partial [Clostridia bacterium]